jgi:hypothetical protein
MFGGGLHAGVLETSNRLLHCDATEVRIRREPLPIATRIRRSSHGTDRWAIYRCQLSFPPCTTASVGHSRKSNVSTLGPEFTAHGNRSLIHHLLVPRRSDCDTTWERAHEVCRAEGSRSVLQTKAAEAKSWNRVHVTHAWARLTYNSTQ